MTLLYCCQLIFHVQNCRSVEPPGSKLSPYAAGSYCMCISSSLSEGRRERLLLNILVMYMRVGVTHGDKV